MKIYLQKLNNMFERVSIDPINGHSFCVSEKSYFKSKRTV